MADDLEAPRAIRRRHHSGLVSLPRDLWTPRTRRWHDQRPRALEGPSDALRVTESIDRSNECSLPASLRYFQFLTRAASRVWVRMPVPDPTAISARSPRPAS